MADKKIEKEVEFPENIDVSLERGIIMIKGPKGEIKRDFTANKIEFEMKDKKLLISSERRTKKEKKAIGSICAHIKNMIKGAVEGHIYKLKVCSGHFPMNVSVKGSEFVIKNFIGEKVPRDLKIKEGANVKIEGDIITVESASKGTAGQVSADIESLTRRTGYDTRIFQDGIYIINKDGKEIK